MKELRVGVVGVGRGMSFARSAKAVGMSLVAICDTWEDKLRQQEKALEVTGYTDFEQFLNHDMDAVILANYFHEHAPLAIQAMRSGFHVMSECAACGTIAEGVELVRAAEETDRIYMLAENYPYMAYNQEMRRLYQAGTIGKFIYGEGEYVHPDPAKVKLARSVGWEHWRNWIPGTYYCTHSLAPVMYITDTRPVTVNGFVLPYDAEDPTVNMSVRCSDLGSAIMLKMDNGAIVKTLHGGLRGHGNYTRIHGNQGLMENSRVMNTSMLRVHRAPFDKNEGEPVESIYQPDFPEFHDQATKTGHGGGDFFTQHHFAAAIRTGEQPYLDVYRGVQMSIVGILAYRSALDGGTPLEVPDFRDPGHQKAYEGDHWSPFPGVECENKPPPSILGHIEANDAAKENAREVWKKQGWTE